jgi:hypothetical protein
MALARGEGLLAIASRLPAHVTWFDAASGKIRRDLPLCGDADDLFRDDRAAALVCQLRLGQDCFLCRKWIILSPMETVASASGARTSLFSPELDRLIVAAPARWGASARLLISNQTIDPKGRHVRSQRHRPAKLMRLWALQMPGADRCPHAG